MRILLEICFLCFLYVLSLRVCDYFSLPIPPTVIGMGMLLLLLISGILKPQHLEKSSEWLTRHMILFCIPIIVGIVQYWGIIEQGGWHLLVTIVLSTIFVLVATAMVTIMFKKRRELK